MKRTCFLSPRKGWLLSPPKCVHTCMCVYSHKHRDPRTASSIMSQAPNAWKLPRKLGSLAIWLQGSACLPPRCWAWIQQLFSLERWISNLGPHSHSQTEPSLQARFRLLLGNGSGKTNEMGGDRGQSLSSLGNNWSRRHRAVRLLTQLLKETGKPHHVWV